MLVQENQTSNLARVETVENWLRNDLNNAIIEAIHYCSIPKEQIVALETLCGKFNKYLVEVQTFHTQSSEKLDC